MESLPEHSFLKFRPDTIVEVRKTYGLEKPGAMSESIDLLEDWIKKQRHFVKKEFDRHYLEIIIISAKGSLERAKTRLDKLCTLRTLLPQFFENHDDVRADFGYTFHVVRHTVLPQLTDDYDLVYLCKVTDEKYNSKIFLDGYKFCIMLVEYLFMHAYWRSLQVVIDYSQARVAEMIAAANLMDLHQALNLCFEAYGIRVKGIHIITPSKMVDTVITIAKQLVSPKLGQRIHVHKTFDRVYEFVPRDLFPCDYGGKEESFIDGHDRCVDMLNTNEFRERRRMLNEACTDESLRQKDKFNEQYAGMPGSFRTLSVD